MGEPQSKITPLERADFTAMQAINVFSETINLLSNTAAQVDPAYRDSTKHAVMDMLGTIATESYLMGYEDRQREEGEA